MSNAKANAIVRLVAENEAMSDVLEEILEYLSRGTDIRFAANTGGVRMGDKIRAALEKRAVK